MSIRNASQKKRSGEPTSDESATAEEKNEARRRWFARNRGDKFSELLRESAGESQVDDEWLVQLDQAEEDGPEGAEDDSSSPDYVETPGQWSDLAIDVDLAWEATAAMQRLETCLSDLDRAVNRARAASRDTRALLQRLQPSPRVSRTGQAVKKKQPAGKKTAKKATSGWVKVQRQTKTG